VRVAAISVSHFRTGFAWKLSTALPDTRAGHVLGKVVSLLLHKVAGIYRYGSQATDLKLVQEPIADFAVEFP
jgi:hypothetical protein